MTAGPDLERPWTQPYDPAASRADILSCFRLLLGRNPHREEWPGHSHRAGEALPGVVASYVNSLEFARRGLQDPLAGAAAPEVAALDGFRLHASRDDLAVGKTVLAGEYEPDVAAVFREVLRPGMGVVDIGANIGFFTMLAASLVGPAGYVLALEPNPRNARMAEASRRLNGFAQATVLQAAAGRAVGVLAINTSFSNGTTSALEDAQVLGAETVACVPVDLVVPRGRRIGLLKLDVEGAEYNALLGCDALIRRNRPAIVFEFGPSQLPGVSGVTGEVLLQWLIARGYTLEILHPSGPRVPIGRDWPAAMAEYERRGHDHIDLLARPAPPGWLRRLWR